MTGSPHSSQPVDVLTFGESMVSLRSAAPLAAGGALTMHLAGAESNVAIGLARLGHRVAWAGRVSADELGEFVLRHLRAEGVGTGHAVVDADRPMGLMFLERRTADVLRVRYNRAGSAGSAVCVEDLRPALAAGARILHLTGITPALSESARQAAIWAARTASAAGTLVCLDVNYRGRLWSRDQARAVLSPLAGHAHVVVASADELDLVTDAPPTDAPRTVEAAAVEAASDKAAAVEAVAAVETAVGEAAVAKSLLDRGVDTVLVKLGAAGARAYTRDGVEHAGAATVTAIDTVGAGDAFTAGYLSGVLDGLDLTGSLRRAVTLGAFAVSTAGDWEGLPRRDELSLLDGYEAGSIIR